jgi:hypothetical protein
MSFQGSIQELPVPDIIQLVSVSGKTGMFMLVRGTERGFIYLRNGRIVHAELGPHTGEEAVYALAIWSTGDFQFSPGKETETVTIEKTNTSLLMEAARRLDEWKRLSPAIASLDLVPEFVTAEDQEGQINLNTGQWLILSKIDGHRTLRVIAAACGLPVLDAARLLHDLVAAGLIRLREPEPS